ncbi:MAG: phosphatase PAP2 family protein [Dehalococcoidia bacterium]|nr:phosphatase PAP2 family protein [Dehalococcoidia bacterium]
MRGLLDALAFHLPSHPLEGAVTLAALIVAAGAWRRVGGPAAAGLAAAGAAGAFVQVGHPAIPLAIAGVGVLHARRGRRIAPRAFARETAIVLAGFLAYEAARFQVVSEPEPAIRNARRIVDLEAAFGLFRERELQQLLAGPGPVTAAWNVIYSHALLAVVIGALLWLAVADPARYRLYRNALGISTVLAIALIAWYPVAPPRLVPGLGIDDTVVAAGDVHRFANEYAAIPSLHVGWLALTGWILALPLRGRARPAVMLGPGLGMLLVVIVTGNHFWLDGVAGVAVTIGPALVLRRRAGIAGFLREAAAALPRIPAAAASPRGRVTTLALGGLFLYLGAGQLLNPGFTDYWGYLFFQVGAMLALLIAGEAFLAREGGLSGLTHGIAIVCAWADVLGTDGGLYARIDEYDKLTHFLGTAAVTAAAWEVLRAAARRAGSTRPPRDRFLLAVAIGVAAGVGWEVYEYLADVVFQTGRNHGRWDTFNDLVSDTAGAMAIAGLLWRQEQRSLSAELEPGPRPRSAPPA